MRYTKLTLLLSLLLALSAAANAQSGHCTLITYWVDRNPFASSSNNLVGQFPLTIEDEPITKLFRHEDSGIPVSVGVQVIKGTSRGIPTMIRLAIAFTEQPNNVFDDLEGSEAESFYDRHWRGLSVSRNIRRGDRTYTFTFGCWKQVARRH